MKKIVWDIQYVSSPPVIRYCKKCGKRTEYLSSEQFRVNAQRKYLDIWLIYKCSNCDTTWNATIYSRINPQSISMQLLECFHNNDQALSRQYAMNTELLQRNGVEVKVPVYKIQGEEFSIIQPVELQIRSEYQFPIKVSAILRNKLKLSQSELFSLIEHGRIHSISKQNIRKMKLNKEATLIFCNHNILNCREEYCYAQHM